MRKKKKSRSGEVTIPEAGEVHKVAGGTRRHYEYTASRNFDAQFAGTCPRCADEIAPGDRVRYVDDELVHATHAPKPRRPIAICPRCHMTQPCECDE